jgi:hypothetical protein
MLQNEELTRLKVNEAIQNGIKAQRIHREITPSKREKSHQGVGLRSYQLVLIVIVISLTLVGTVAAFNIF